MKNNKKLRYFTGAFCLYDVGCETTLVPLPLKDQDQ
nr:hypothetical protein [Mucilaginibacter sp. X4EP1]